jgi:Skp family chaperone for outer membrane proteins
MIFGLASLAIAAAGVAWTARGWMAPPTAVAVVDMNRLKTSLDEFKQIESKISDLMAPNDQLVKAMGDELKEKRERLETERETMGERELLALQADVARLQLNIQAQQREIMPAMFDAVALPEIATLNQKIIDAVQRVAERDGWDIIMIDPRAQPQLQLNTAPNLGELNTRMRARLFLYVNQNTADITDEVLTLMNNDFNAGGVQSATP